MVVSAITAQKMHYDGNPRTPLGPSLLVAITAQQMHYDCRQLTQAAAGWQLVTVAVLAGTATTVRTDSWSHATVATSLLLLPSVWHNCAE